MQHRLDILSTRPSSVSASPVQVAGAYLYLRFVDMVFCVLKMPFCVHVSSCALKHGALFLTEVSTMTVME